MERREDAAVTTTKTNAHASTHTTDDKTDTTHQQKQQQPTPTPNAPRPTQHANAAYASSVGQPHARPPGLANAQQQQQQQPFPYPPAPHHASTMAHAPYYVHPRLQQPFQQQQLAQYRHTLQQQHSAAAMSLVERQAAAAQQLAYANSLMAAGYHPSQLQAGHAQASAANAVAAPPAAPAQPPMIVTVPSHVNPGERLLVISPSGAQYMIVVPANALPNTRIRVTIPSEELKMPEAVANPVHFPSMLHPGMVSDMASMVAAQFHANLPCGADGHAHLPPGYDVAPNGGQPHKRRKAIKKRAPRPSSAYNLFIKDELVRLKAKNPELPHKEAFAQAAKNWRTSDIKNKGGAGTPNEAPADGDGAPSETPAAERGEADARCGDDGFRGDEGDADEGGDATHSLVVGPDQDEPSDAGDAVDAGDAGVEGVEGADGSFDSSDSPDPSKLPAATTSKEAGVSASPAAADDGADGAS